MVQLCFERDMKMAAIVPRLFRDIKDVDLWIFDHPASVVDTSCHILLHLVSGTVFLRP
jgi:hypothetical protein